MICDPNGTPVEDQWQIRDVLSAIRGFRCLLLRRLLIKWSHRTVNIPKLPPSWVRPYEPCVAVANYSKANPDDIVLFIAGTLNGKGKWFYAISEMLFSKADLTQKVDQLDDCIMTAREPYESGTSTNVSG